MLSFYELHNGYNRGAFNWVPSKWVFLFVLAVFGYDWIQPSVLKEWNAQISVLLIGIAYMFGLIFDRLASAFKFPVEYHSFRFPEFLARMNILMSNDKAHEYFEKRINQPRLLRATFFNLILIFISALTFTLIRVNFSWKLLAFICVFSVAMIGITFITWVSFSRILLQEIRSAFKVIQEPKMPDKKSAK